MPPLTPEQVQQKLQTLDGWRLEDGQIVREFTFGNFTQSLDFVNRVGALAEAMDHHPDITILYNKVILVLSTHSEGGLTPKDFDLAGQIDRTVPGA